jgi:hypothetical protein
MSNKSTAKGWFETGDKPTQSQFHQTFDYLRWKDELIPISEVEGLSTLLGTLPTNARVQALEPITGTNVSSLVVPAFSVIEMIAIFSNTDAVVNIGTTNGGTEYYEGAAIANGYALVEYKMATTTNTTLYFDNIPAGATIKIYKR